MPSNLIFIHPRHTGGPVPLVFGADTVPPVLPVSVTGESALGGVTGSGAVFIVPLPVSVAGQSALGGVTGSGAALYDNRNPRRASARAVLPFQPATPRPGGTAAGWGQSARMLAQPAAAWGKAAPAIADPATHWVVATSKTTQRSPAWVLAAQRATQAQAVHQAAAPRHTQAQAWWQTAQGRALHAALVHQAARSLVRQARAPWQLAHAMQALVVARNGRGVARLSQLLAPWQTARPVPAGREVWPPVQPTTPPRVPNTHLLFACPPWAGGAAHLVFGRTCAYLPAQTTIPIRRAYVTINRIELINLDNAATLPATDFALDIDADSWTWSWSATLHSSAAALVQPYDELQATINNVPYRLAVGEIGRSKQFPTDRLKISGRGIAQELADPQAPVTTYGADTERTAQQLMADVLTVNGVPLGWAIDWQITDWLVPANAWTIQGTAMQALIDIASAAGAYIQPHPTARTLCVLPRYPLPPWEWSASAPALELPAAVCATESTQMVIRPAYNRIFVGGTSAGVFGPVTRSGTAGDVLAPQISHPLITDAAVHRQRGIAELANTGRQTHMTLSLPVLPATGLILPGTMVRHRDGSRTHTGIVRSTGVRWASPAMRQTIGLECHELA